MPNTLAHAGAQGLATRTARSDVDLKWVYLSCVVPDLPWILQRAAHVMVPGVDPYALRSYVIIQASLLGCLLFSAAVALLARRGWTTFAVLAGNAVLHLGLDAMQTKWGNGVNFLAPLSWELTNWGLFWPESVPTYVFTALGLLFIGWYWRTTVRQKLDLIWPSTWRLAGILALLGSYFFGPLFLLQEPIEADAHSLGTLSGTQVRTGRHVEMDRARYVRTQEGTFLRYYGGKEQVRVEDLGMSSPATVSIRGVFADENTVRVTEYHIHAGGLRDYPTYLGLGVISIVWIAAACRAVSH